MYKVVSFEFKFIIFKLYFLAFEEGKEFSNQTLLCSVFVFSRTEHCQDVTNQSSDDYLYLKFS